MSIRLIQDRLDTYGCQGPIEEEQALREITQEVVLAALGRTDFFSNAAFHGGSSLRIFYGLNRFSEDLDFALHRPGDRFNLQPYIKSIAMELTAYGYQLEIQDRPQADRIVKKTFLKDDSLIRVLHMNHLRPDRSAKTIRIKFKVDSNPPQGAVIESKFLDFPFVSSVVVHDLPSLFAGKIHALLCRPHVKGRDWYDFIWYTGRGTSINHALLSAALHQQGPWQGQGLKTDTPWCIEQLRGKIHSIPWDQAAADVQGFVKTHELPSLKLWSEVFFLSQLDKYASKGSRS